MFDEVKAAAGRHLDKSLSEVASIGLPIVEQLKFKICNLRPGKGIALSLPHQDHEKSHVLLDK